MRFNPSAAGRWLTGGCTGSPAAEAAAIKLPPSKKAAEGRRLHDVAADLITNHGVGNADDLDVIGDYVDDVRRTRVLYGPSAVARAEHWVDHPDHPGKVDFSLLTSSRLIIWDLKCGHRPIEAEKNAQLITYALAMEPGPGVAVELRIAQSPGARPGEAIKKWTVSDLTLWRVMRDRAVAEAKGQEPRLVATPSNCLYCKAVSTCPAARNVTLGGEDIAARQVGHMKSADVRQELVTLRNVSRMVNDRLVAVEAEAEERMRRGEALKGCMMAPGQGGSLKWTADEAKIKATCVLLGHSATVEAKLRTPTQMIEAGIPAAVVATLATRTSPKLSVSTEAAAITAKLFHDYTIPSNT